MKNYSEENEELNDKKELIYLLVWEIVKKNFYILVKICLLGYFF